MDDGRADGDGCGGGDVPPRSGPGDRTLPAPQKHMWDKFIADAAKSQEWLDGVVQHWDSEKRFGFVLPEKALEMFPAASANVRRRECGVYCHVTALPAADGIGVLPQLTLGDPVQLRVSVTDAGKKISVSMVRAGSARDDGTARFPYETEPSPMQGEVEVKVGNAISPDYWQAVRKAHPDWIPLAATRTLLDMLQKLGKKGQGVSRHAKDRADECAEYSELNLRSTIASAVHHNLFESMGRVVVAGTEHYAIISRDLCSVVTLLPARPTYADWKDKERSRKAQALGGAFARSPKESAKSHSPKASSRGKELKSDSRARSHSPKARGKGDECKEPKLRPGGGGHSDRGGKNDKQRMNAKSEGGRSPKRGGQSKGNFAWRFWSDLAYHCHNYK